MDGGKAFKVSLSQNLGFMPAVLQRFFLFVFFLVLFSFLFFFFLCTY